MAFKQDSSSFDYSNSESENHKESFNEHLISKELKPNLIQFDDEIDALSDRKCTKPKEKLNELFDQVKKKRISCHSFNSLSLNDNKASFEKQSNDCNTSKFLSFIQDFKSEQVKSGPKVAIRSFINSNNSNFNSTKDISCNDHFMKMNMNNSSIEPTIPKIEVMNEHRERTNRLEMLLDEEDEIANNSHCYTKVSSIASMLLKLELVIQI